MFSGEEMADTQRITRIRAWLSLIRDFEVNSKISRTVTLLWMLWITTEVFRWAMSFAESSISSVDKALVLGAILTPLAGLHAAIFSFYRSPPTPVIVNRQKSDAEEGKG